MGKGVVFPQAGASWSPYIYILSSPAFCIYPSQYSQIDRLSALPASPHIRLGALLFSFCDLSNFPSTNTAYLTTKKANRLMGLLPSSILLFEIQKLPLTGGISSRGGLRIEWTLHGLPGSQERPPLFPLKPLLWQCPLVTLPLYSWLSAYIRQAWIIPATTFTFISISHNLNPFPQSASCQVLALKPFRINWLCTSWVITYTLFPEFPECISFQKKSWVTEEEPLLVSFLDVSHSWSIFIIQTGV